MPGDDGVTREAQEEVGSSPGVCEEGPKEGDQQSPEVQEGIPDPGVAVLTRAALEALESKHYSIFSGRYLDLYEKWQAEGNEQARTEAFLIFALDKAQNGALSEVDRLLREINFEDGLGRPIPVSEDSVVILAKLVEVGASKLDRTVNAVPFLDTVIKVLDRANEKLHRQLIVWPDRSSSRPLPATSRDCD